MRRTARAPVAAVLIALSLLPMLAACGTTPTTEVSGQVQPGATSNSRSTSTPGSSKGTATPGTSGGTDVTREEIETNRRRWNDTKPESYTFHVTNRNNHYSVEQEMTVENGELTKKTTVKTSRSAPRSSLDFISIDDVFDRAERSVGKVDRLSVSFDDTYGYPTSLSVDPKESTNDDEFSITISELQAR